LFQIKPLSYAEREEVRAKEAEDEAAASLAVREEQVYLTECID